MCALRSVKCERRPRVAGAARGGRGDDGADVLVADAAVLLDRAKQRAALAVLEQVCQKLCIERLWDRNGPRPIALGLEHHELLTLAVDVCHVQAAQLVGSKAA